MNTGHIPTDSNNRTNIASTKGCMNKAIKISCLTLIAVFIGIFFLIGIVTECSRSFGDDTIRPTADSTATINNSIEQAKQVLRIDSAKLSDGYFEKIEDIKSVKELSQKREYLHELAMLDYLINKIPDQNIFNDSQVKPQFEANRQKAQKVYKKVMPKYRDKYRKLLGNALWEENIKVKGSGTNIMFIGGIFANNKNIKDFHTQICGDLQVFGFKRASYKWVDANVEYTYYDIEPLSSLEE